MTARLPTPGSDSGSWGDLLNAWLLVGHDADGNNVGGKLPENAKAANYTISTGDEGTRLVATAPLTFTIPTVGILGNGFECEIVNLSGGTVILDGPGAINVTMVDSDVASLLESNGKQLVVKGGGTIVS